MLPYHPSWCHRNMKNSIYGLFCFSPHCFDQLYSICLIRTMYRCPYVLLFPRSPRLLYKGDKDHNTAPNAHFLVVRCFYGPLVFNSMKLVHIRRHQAIKWMPYNHKLEVMFKSVVYLLHGIVPQCSIPTMDDIVNPRLRPTFYSQIFKILVS